MKCLEKFLLREERESRITRASSDGEDSAIMSPKIAYPTCRQSVIGQMIEKLRHRSEPLLAHRATGNHYAVAPLRD
jgi:hypothetical protein